MVVSTPPDTVRARAGDSAATLSELVPEVGAILRPLPSERASPDIERRRAFDAISAFVRGLSVRRPVLLFLDDLHNAGSSTPELLHFLLRRAAGTRLLILATLRLEEGDETLFYLRDASRVMEVGPLSADAVSELASNGLARSGRSLARTGGRTLFVLGALRAIAEAPRRRRCAGARILREAVLARVSRAGADVGSFCAWGPFWGSAFELFC